MKRIALAAALTTATATSALAAGLDRSGQNVLAIFDDPNTLTFSVSHVMPSVTGTDAGNGSSYDVNGSYTQVLASYANEINETLSYAVIFDQPFGLDLLYGSTAATDALAGTKGDVTSQALTFLLKHKFNDQISAFGGIRAQEVTGDITLNGGGWAVAFASNLVPASGTTAISNDGTTSTFITGGGYNAKYSSSWGVGYTVGGAYEKPDIALRAALTYHSEVTHDTNVIETSGPNTIGNGTGSFQTPQSINFDFQTGINESTLLMAGVRWTDWDDFALTPPQLNSNLASISGEFRYNLGLAKRFNENFVGLASLTYEKDGGGATISTLGPVDGQIGLSLGGRYTSGNVNLSGGVSYTKLGGANAAIGPTTVASFTDNSAVGVGFKLEYSF